MRLEHGLIRDADHGAGMPAPDADRVAATAPGDTHVALHRAGHLPDPLRDPRADAAPPPPRAAGAR